jgi:uncharacterized membrane protein YdbT with pleckstrin-like domain
MTPPAVHPTKTAIAESPSAAMPKAAAAAGLELLGDDEIIQLSIRPSLWCIVLYSWKLVTATILLAMSILVATRGQPSFGVSIAVVVMLMLAFSIIAAATLQWASQLYVLTNRRVLRFHGVFSVDVRELGLKQVAEVQNHAAWYHPLLRLGSLCMTPTTADKQAVLWEHVARPDEIQQIVQQAIRRAKSR